MGAGDGGGRAVELYVSWANPWLRKLWEERSWKLEGHTGEEREGKREWEDE